MTVINVIVWLVVCCYTPEEKSKGTTGLSSSCHDPALWQGELDQLSLPAGIKKKTHWCWARLHWHWWGFEPCREWPTCGWWMRCTWLPVQRPQRLCNVLNCRPTSSSSSSSSFPLSISSFANLIPSSTNCLPPAPELPPLKPAALELEAGLYLFALVWLVAEGRYCLDPLQSMQHWRWFCLESTLKSCPMIPSHLFSGSIMIWTSSSSPFPPVRISCIEAPYPQNPDTAFSMLKYRVTSGAVSTISAFISPALSLCFHPPSIWWIFSCSSVPSRFNGQTRMLKITHQSFTYLSCCCQCFATGFRALSEDDAPPATGKAPGCTS